MLGGDANLISCCDTSNTGSKSVLLYVHFQFLYFRIGCNTGVDLSSKQQSYGDLSPSNRGRLLKMDVAPSSQCV